MSSFGFVVLFVVRGLSFVEGRSLRLLFAHCLLCVAPCLMSVVCYVLFGGRCSVRMSRRVFLVVCCVAFFSFFCIDDYSSFLVVVVGCCLFIVIRLAFVVKCSCSL